MVATILLFLFIGQVLSFYFIILLYTKISKLKDIEKSQSRLKDEMDNAIGVYLAEMRDENDRLIKELTKMNEKSQKEENVNENIKQASFYEENVKTTFSTPRNIAAKAYKNSPNLMTAATTEKESSAEDKEQPKPSIALLTEDQQIQELYRNGKNIEEIAKLLRKGKTEIELLLKFQR
jgi:hypothetical protein